MTNDRQFAATNDGRVCALFNVDIVCYFSERCYFFFFACPVAFFFAVYLHCELDGRTSKRLLFGYESQADLVRNAQFFYKDKAGLTPEDVSSLHNRLSPRSLWRWQASGTCDE